MHVYDYSHKVPFGFCNVKLIAFGMQTMQKKGMTLDGNGQSVINVHDVCRHDYGMLMSLLCRHLQIECCQAFFCLNDFGTVSSYSTVACSHGPVICHDVVVMQLGGL